MNLISEDEPTPVDVLNSSNLPREGAFMVYLKQGKDSLSDEVVLTVVYHNGDILRETRLRTEWRERLGI